MVTHTGNFIAFLRFLGVGSTAKPFIYAVDVFIGYGSEIHLVETEKRQRKPRSAQYRQAWELQRFSGR